MMERRQFTRFSLSSEVELRLNSNIWSSQLLDLSLKGALIVNPNGFQGLPGDTIWLSIFLQTTNTIHFEGIVSHIGNNHIGLRCERMDIDSMTELRRVIELNMGDDSLLHRELHALVTAG